MKFKICQYQVKRKSQELEIDLLSSRLKAALALFLRTRSLLLGCVIPTLLSPCCLEACALVIKRLGYGEKFKKLMEILVHGLLTVKNFLLKTIIFINQVPQPLGSDPTP